MKALSRRSTVVGWGRLQNNPRDVLEGMDPIRPLAEVKLDHPLPFIVLLNTMGNISYRRHVFSISCRGRNGSVPNPSRGRSTLTPSPPPASLSLDGLSEEAVSALAASRRHFYRSHAVLRRDKR